MGWDSYHATEYKANGQVDRKAECDKNLTWENEKIKMEVLKSQMVGTTYYAAVKRTDKDKDASESEVFGVVTLTQGVDRRDPYFNFAKKDMSEDMGPTESKCPLSILKLLTPTDSEWAREWRQRCYEYHENKKKRSWLKDLPLGSKIIWTRWDGEEIALTKSPPAAQFKTWFWCDEASNRYVQKKYVTEENSRLVA